MSVIGASFVLGSFILCLFLYYAKTKNKKPLGFPPGPPTLPILGSSIFMPRKVWYTGEVPISDYLNDKYGDVAGLYRQTAPGSLTLKSFLKGSKTLMNFSDCKICQVFRVLSLDQICIAVISLVTIRNLVQLFSRILDVNRSSKKFRG